MTNKIVSDFYCDEVEEIAQETRSYLAEAIQLCVEDGEIFAFLKGQLLARKDGEPLASWRIQPSCLLRGADNEFLRRYAWAVQKIRSKPSPRQAQRLPLEAMLRDRLAGQTAAGQRKFLRDALTLDTDISALYNLLRFCDRENEALRDSLCRHYGLNREEFREQKRDKAQDRDNLVTMVKQAVEVRNDYLGHRTQGDSLNMTAEDFEESVRVFPALAARMPLPDPAPLQALRDHRDRVVRTAQCPPLPLATLQQRIPEFDLFILRQSRLSGHYDVKGETLYLHPLSEVSQVMLGIQKQYDKADDRFRKELGVIREHQSQIDQTLNTIAEKLDRDPAAPPPAAPAPVRCALAPFPRMADYTAGRLSEGQKEEVFRRCNLLADLSCWLQQDGRSFLTEQVLPLQRGSGKWVIVDWATRVELYRLETDPATPAGRKRQAHEARIAMSHLHRQGMIKYAPERAGVRTSQASLMEVVARNPDKTICLLTMDWAFCQVLAKRQDPNLMPLLLLGKQGCAVHPLLRELVHRNSLGHPAGEESAPAAQPAAPAAPEKSAQAPAMPAPAKANPIPAPAPVKAAPAPETPAPPAAKAAPAHTPADNPPVACIPETGVLLPWQKPEEGMTLHTRSGRKVRLGARMAEGGEGMIYATDDPNLVAKLYNKTHLTRNRRDKLTRMVGRSLQMRELCWPTDLLFHDRGNHFAGFLMPRVGPEYRELTTSILQLAKPTVRQNLPGWDRLALVRVCRRICRMLEQLHRAGILLGDINPRNILVRTDRPQDPAIMVVDCDSCQIDGYPCPVGTPLHTSPALYKRLKTANPSYGTFLRTDQDEDFALAVLLFELLMLNQSPYSGKGVTDLGQAVREGRFAYRFVPRGSSEAAIDGSGTPDGPYRMIWGNMPYQTREGFYNTFAQGKPLSARQWGQVLASYEREMTTSNIYTRELTPQRYFDPDGSFTVDFVCEECGREANMPKSQWENNQLHKRINLCNNCFSAMWRLREDPQKVMVHCAVCGKPFPGNKWQATLEARNQAKRGFWQDRVCPDCRQEVQTTCHRCHKPVTVTNAKLRSLKKNNRSVLCADCLNRRNSG